MSTGPKVPSPEALNLDELAMKKAAPFGLREGPPAGRVPYLIINRAGRRAKNKKKGNNQCYAYE